MNDLFKTLIDEGVVVVYMDGILIFTESLEQHHETVQNALEILYTNHLYLKLKKCLFMQLKVEYLGLILSQGEVAMDPCKSIWCSGLATTTQCDRSKILPRLHSLLLTIHQRLLPHCQTSKSTHKGECIMVLDARWGRTISI